MTKKARVIIAIVLMALALIVLIAIGLLHLLGNGPNFGVTAGGIFGALIILQVARSVAKSQ